MADDLGGNYAAEIIGAKTIERLRPAGLDQVTLPYPKQGPTVLSKQDVAQAGSPTGRAPQKAGRDNGCPFRAGGRGRGDERLFGAASWRDGSTTSPISTEADQQKSCR